MATSAVPAAIAWLVDTFRAADTLGAADPPVSIRDGPEIGDDAVPQILWVAVDDPDEPVPGASLSNQSWAGIGARRKDEHLSIPCTARAWNGDGDIRAARESAFAVLAAVEIILRGNVDLGGIVLFQLNGVDNLRLRTAVRERGAIADLGFVVDTKARI